MYKQLNKLNGLDISKLTTEKNIMEQISNKEKVYLVSNNIKNIENVLYTLLVNNYKVYLASNYFYKVFDVCIEGNKLVLNGNSDSFNSNYYDNVNTIIGVPFKRGKKVFKNDVINVYENCLPNGNIKNIDGTVDVSITGLYYNYDILNNSLIKSESKFDTEFDAILNIKREMVNNFNTSYKVFCKPMIFNTDFCKILSISDIIELKKLYPKKMDKLAEMIGTECLKINAISKNFIISNKAIAIMALCGLDILPVFNTDNISEFEFVANALLNDLYDKKDGIIEVLKRFL